MPFLTRRRAALAAIALPSLIRLSHADVPADWRLSDGADWTDFMKRFDEIGTKGALMILDAPRGGRLLVNPERVKTRYAPGSSFNIPTGIIALQTGAAKDVDEERFQSAREPVTTGGAQPAQACGGAMTLRDAFRNSCPWVFQELARRIGADAYKEWLTKFDYGQGETGGAPIDSFWQSGPLTISAEEQAKFIRRLITKTLPISPRSASLAEEIMFIEKIGDTAIHGANGPVEGASSAVGWWVGYAQRDENVVVIALNLDVRRPEHGPARYELVKAALRDIRML